MFGSADVQINLVPVIRCFTVAKFFFIMRVHVAEKIPTAAGIAGHGISFKPSPAPSEGGGVDPFC